MIQMQKKMIKKNKDADSKADDTDKDAKDSKTSEGKTLADLNLEDGDYTMDVTPHRRFRKSNH